MRTKLAIVANQKPKEEWPTIEHKFQRVNSGLHLEISRDPEKPLTKYCLSNKLALLHDVTYYKALIRCPLSLYV